MAALTLLLAGAAAMDTCPGWEVPACSDGTCLHVKEACQGVSLCEGDRAWCHDPPGRASNTLPETLTARGSSGGNLFIPLTLVTARVTTAWTGVTSQC